MLIDDDVGRGVIDGCNRAEAVFVEKGLERPKLILVKENVHNVSFVPFPVHCEC
jgi:hypothetical protein